MQSTASGEREDLPGSQQKGVQERRDPSRQVKMIRAQKDVDSLGTSFSSKWAMLRTSALVLCVRCPLVPPCLLTVSGVHKLVQWVTSRDLAQQA